SPTPAAWIGDEFMDSVIDGDRTGIGFEGEPASDETMRHAVAIAVELQTGTRLISIDCGRPWLPCMRTSWYTNPTKRCTWFKMVLTCIPVVEWLISSVDESRSLQLQINPTRWRSAILLGRLSCRTGA